MGRGRERRGGEGREVGEKGRGGRPPNVRDALTPLGTYVIIATND